MQRFVVAVVGILASVASAQSASGTASCPACTLEQEKARAESLGPGHWLIYDVPSVGLSYWSVTSGRTYRDRETGQYEVTPGAVEQLVVPAQTLAAFKTAVTGPTQTSVTFTPGGPAAPQFPDLPNPVYTLDYNFSAFIHAANPDLRSRIEGMLTSWMYGSASQGGELYNLIRSIIAEIAGNRIITVTIVYADGSREQYRLNRFSTNGYTNAHYVPGSATDHNGNPVPDAAVVNDPDTGGVYEGVFEFSTSYELTAWIEAMESMGVPVTGACRTRVGCVRLGNGPLECSCPP